MGPSGSGKSSLLAVAATLVRPSSGDVVIDGINTAGLKDKEPTALRREKVGIIFQQPNLLASPTAVEQLIIGHHLRGRPLKAARSRATVMVTHDTEFVPLTDAVAVMRDGGLTAPALPGAGARSRVPSWTQSAERPAPSPRPSTLV